MASVTLRRVKRTPKQKAEMGKGLTTDHGPRDQMTKGPRDQGQKLKLEKQTCLRREASARQEAKMGTDGGHVRCLRGAELGVARIRLMHSIMGVRRENLAMDSKVVKPAPSRRGR